LGKLAKLAEIVKFVDTSKTGETWSVAASLGSDHTNKMLVLSNAFFGMLPAMGAIKRDG